jgi:hypothetical protein
VDARQRVELTSTNEPFGLAKVSKPSFGWVESEVPSDMHACLITSRPERAEGEHPREGFALERRRWILCNRVTLAGSSIGRRWALILLQYGELSSPLPSRPVMG